MVKEKAHIPESHAPVNLECRAKLPFRLGEFLLVELGTLGKYLCRLVFPPFDQNALQAADDYDGQDDALILVRFELAAQPLGGFPDVAGEVIELGFVERERHGRRFPISEVTASVGESANCFQNCQPHDALLQFLHVVIVMSSCGALYTLGYSCATTRYSAPGMLTGEHDRDAPVG